MCELAIYCWVYFLIAETLRKLVLQHCNKVSFFFSFSFGKVTKFCHA